MLYRKKPVGIVVVKAELLTNDYAEAAKVAAWCHGELTDKYGEGICILVTTAQGQQVPVYPGEWIILEGPDHPNRAYPCDGEVFGRTYELAETNNGGD